MTRSILVSVVYNPPKEGDMGEQQRPGRGGARPGAGRPISTGGPIFKTSVALPRSDVEYLKAHWGTVSHGVRELVAEHREREAQAHEKETDRDD